MIRIAIISDVHGNLPALETVLSDINDRKIDKIICLGDLAGKGPSSAEVVDLVRNRCDSVVKGNWDYFMTEEKADVLLWHQNKLGLERLEYLKSLPIYNEFYISGKLVRLCHASPNDIFHRTYISTDLEERLRLFEPSDETQQPADVVGYGDIHGAYLDNFDGKTIFNAGSVGNPLDMPLASYAILEGMYGSKSESSFSVSIVRVPYDIELAVEHALITDMPEKELYINELRTAVYRWKANK